MRQTLLLALVAASLTAANQLRGAMSPPQITPGFPVFAALKHRQAQTCEGAATLCADGDGCCPYGEACGYTTTQGQVYGICEGTCKIGVATCTAPIRACCQTVGDLCGADGTCTAPNGGGGQSTLPVTASNTFNLPPVTITTTSLYTTPYIPPTTSRPIYTTTSSTSAAGLDTSYDTSTETFSGFGGGSGSSDTTSAAVTVTVTPSASGNAGNMLRGMDNNVLLGLPFLGYAAGYLFGEH